MRKGYSSMFWTLLILLPTRGYGQVTVNGPTCVIPGTVYQYLIAGPWDSSSTLQVCLTGGLTADSGQSCTSNGQPRTSVLVTWDSIGVMTFQITSSKGNKSIAVMVTNPLSGGTIDSASQSQSVPFDSIPEPVTCGPASGGTCSPVFQYQWQQSLDMVTWQNIVGDTIQNLSLSQSVTQSTFVRRQVTESTSGTIAYSNVAVINVGPPPPGSSLILKRQQDLNAYIAFASPILNSKPF